MNETKPIAITLGDPHGVGPEILLRAFAEGHLEDASVVYGDVAAIEACQRALGLNLPVRSVSAPREARAGELCVMDAMVIARDDLRPGTLSAAAGAAAYSYIEQATRAALAEEVSAVVTLPVNKEAIQFTRPGFSGHTELLGELCGAPDVTILLASEQLIVSHVSTHVSLAEAIRRVQKERVLRIIELTCSAVARLRENPRVAVAGLNPHASENGMFGDEEAREIAPAVEAAIALGLPVDGPFPPDTLFYLAVREKQFNAIVCMYHDQGHIPLKLLDFDGGVNITLGLPILRTSVDHGTAFNIAWQGKARIRSFVEALDYARRLRGMPLHA
jgi:4-phospho-D-threonate 3-dehydrogenase / 4-phospho-D-erythronate 3-dehydrogenase